MSLTARRKLNEWKDRLQRQVGVRDALLEEKGQLTQETEDRRQQALTATEALNFVEDSV